MAFSRSIIPHCYVELKKHTDISTRYPSTIAKSLPSSWAIAEVLLSSSYRGWGTSSLAKDARELSECVSYFASLRPSAKIVLMGHSTGCQDIMEYLLGKGKLFDS
jgi:triacylglycerol esterase/lipase EstA (alpha/beta hydrolase family)